MGIERKTKDFTIVGREDVTEHHRQTAIVLLNQIKKHKLGDDIRVTYSDISAVTKRDCHTVVPYDAGELSCICNILGLPLISVIVVTKVEKERNSGIISSGYYKLHEKIYDYKITDKKEIFRQELQRIIDCEEWYKLEQYLALKPHEQVFTGQQHSKKTLERDLSTIGKKHDFLDDYPEYIKDISLTKNSIKKRTNRHQELVHELAVFLYDNMYTHIYDTPMDYVAKKTDPDADILLFEVKTIDKDSKDELYQARSALGQLLFYAKLNMDLFPFQGKAKIIKFALFEKKISEEYISVLEENKCFVVWKENGQFTGTTSAQKRLKKNGVII